MQVARRVLRKFRRIHSGNYVWVTTKVLRGSPPLNPQLRGRNKKVRKRPRGLRRQTSRHWKAKRLTTTETTYERRRTPFFLFPFLAVRPFLFVCQCL